jgi:hypothetical protein
MTLLFYSEVLRGKIRVSTSIDRDLMVCVEFFLRAWVAITP